MAGENHLELVLDLCHPLIFRGQLVLALAFVGAQLDVLILLKHLTSNVEGKIFRVDDILAEVEMLENEFFAVVHGEAVINVELAVIF